MPDFDGCLGSTGSFCVAGRCVYGIEVQLAGHQQNVHILGIQSDQRIDLFDGCVKSLIVAKLLNEGRSEVAAIGCPLHSLF